MTTSGQAATGILFVPSPPALLFFMDRDIRDVLSLVNITPTHLPVPGAHGFATSPSATAVQPVYNVSTNTVRIALACRRFRHV